MRKLKHLDLFSGIGGFSLGLEATGGFETIGFSEIDPCASAVLKKHWPKVKNYGDIGNVPRLCCDVLTGGFPCQPFSQAGKQRGAADDRHLWPAMLDVIKRCRPTWCVCENVPGIIGMELDNCIADLENEGYEVQTFIVPACAVDARHRRDRVWIIAHRSRGTLRAESEIKRDSPDEKIPDGSGEVDANSNKRHGEQSPEKIRARRNSIDATVNANKTRTRLAESSNASRWPAEPGLGRMVHGLSRGSYESKTVQKRLEALGNTIVPQIAQIFGEIILNIECGAD